MSRDYRDDWTSSPAPVRTSGSRRYRRLLNRVFIVGAFLICLVILGAAVLGGMRLVEARSASTTTTTGVATVVTVDIASGMGATQVGKLLEEKGVIESSSAFVDLVKARGSEDKLRPGIYSLAQGEELIAVVEKLEKGEGLPSQKLTIPEGQAVSQTAAQLNKGDAIDGDEYEKLAADPTGFTIPKVGRTAPRVETLEGLLFPSTYYLLSGDGAEEFIAAQLEAFAAKTEELPWGNIDELGVSAYEVVIIASLIEKEARIADERNKVAAVIYNRLKKDMTLGIDATVRYALDKWTGSLTKDDLDVDSPYNTRVNKGLPPTPICSPGVAALEAALDPADVDFLYYVLTDTEGNHFFTADYDEFLEAKEQAPEQ